MKPSQRMATISSLVLLAKKNGWDRLALQSLFQIHADRAAKSVQLIIQQAIDEGDDPEWIRGVLSNQLGENS